MEYQALKCYYIPSGGKKRELITNFIEKLSQLADFEHGFNICVHEINVAADDGQTELTYGIDLENVTATAAAVGTMSASNSTISATDKEINHILKNPEPPNDIKKPIAKYGNPYNVFTMDLLPTEPQFSLGKVQEVALLHIEDISEFYLQIINEQTQKIATEIEPKLKELFKHLDKKALAKGFKPHPFYIYYLPDF